MIKHLLAALAIVASCAAGARADAFTPSLPQGITVYVTATASTTDVNATFNTTKASKTAFAGVAAFNAAKTAAGSAATLADLGVSQKAMDGGSVETVRVTVAPADASGVRSRLQAAGFSNDEVAIVARDPDALRGQALAKATRIARIQAEAAAGGDNRHIGRLLNIAPSPTSMLQDLTAAFGNVPQVAQFLSGPGTTATASALVSGYYTFELVP